MEKVKNVFFQNSCAKNFNVNNFKNMFDFESFNFEK